MGAPKYGLQKDDNQPEIVTALRAIGCSVVVMHAPCDLLVGWRGRTMLLEVKDGKKRPSRRKLTTDQTLFVAEWRGHCAVVESVDQAIAAVQRATLR